MSPRFFFFFFNDTATTEIYTLSLHDALPISAPGGHPLHAAGSQQAGVALVVAVAHAAGEHVRSEEHTSELQSRPHLVCRLLLEKKKRIDNGTIRRGVTAEHRDSGIRFRKLSK